MRPKIIGVAILVAIVIFGVVVTQFNGKDKPTNVSNMIPAAGQTTDANNLVTVKGFIGGEKIGFFDDQQVKDLLAKQGIIVDYSKAGSIEMVRGDTKDSDFLFPSSQTALEIFKENRKMVKSQYIFNSPIVIYSWDTVTDGLVKAGIAKKVDSSYYLVDFPKLINLIIAGKKWSDIGIGDLYGRITIVTTDPTKSNSGNQFAGLLANILNNGEVVDDTTLNNVMPKLKLFFSKLGYLESSSGDLFSKYLNEGLGSKPMIVGYENQMVEFAAQYPDQWQNIKGRVRILYPVPTVWSNHPVISLDDQGNRLIQALSSKEVQKLAWEKHGLRTGLVGIQNDPKILTVVGIPDKITQVTPMPKASVMDKIIQGLQ